MGGCGATLRSFRSFEFDRDRSSQPTDIGSYGSALNEKVFADSPGSESPVS